MNINEAFTAWHAEAWPAIHEANETERLHAAFMAGFRTEAVADCTSAFIAWERRAMRRTRSPMYYECYRDAFADGYAKAKKELSQ